jgi:DNA-binding transcriptional ArsR family regulator
VSDPASGSVPSLRALAHPLRLRILSLLTGTELSAAEVARELGVTHANASYHLRLLLDAGEVVVAGEEKIRGGVAKRYRHPRREEVRPGRPAQALDHTEPATSEATELTVAALAEELRRRHRGRRPDVGGLLTDAELWVTPEVYDEVRDLLTRATVLLHDNAQAARTAGTEPVSLTIASFPMRTDTP